MNNVFVISDRLFVIGRGVMIAAVGSFFVVITATTILWPIGVGVYALILFVGWRDIWRSVCEIRMEADGTVTFLRLTGSMSMPACAIRRVQGVRAADYDGDVSWHMQVWTLGETFTVDFFERAMEFVGDLRAMNPSLLVDGEWPVLNPWDPGLRSNGAHLDRG